MRVITVSRTFPGYHPKAGQPTYFVEKILRTVPVRNWANVPESIEAFPTSLRKYDPKLHTIRAGNRWKAGDMAALKYWSGRPYHSTPIKFAEVEIKKVWPIKIEGGVIKIDIGLAWEYFSPLDIDDVGELAANDGLSVDDLTAWFKMPVKETFIGQIICWSGKVNY